MRYPYQMCFMVLYQVSKIFASLPKSGSVIIFTTSIWMSLNVLQYLVCHPKYCHYSCPEPNSLHILIPVFQVFFDSGTELFISKLNNTNVIFLKVSNC